MTLLEQIENLRFSYEANLIERIISKTGDLPPRDYSEAQLLLNARKRELLSDAVLITYELSPELYQVYQECLDTLGGSVQGDLFVQNSKEYNANVFASESNFDILINSVLVEDLGEDELKFVIGHELGHVVFEHSKFPALEILNTIHSIPKDVANLMYRWSRAAEISADRIGLLCCEKLTEASVALFQTSSGLKGINKDKISKSFSIQYEILENHLKESKINFRSKIQRSHPIFPIRFKALELANLDIVALKRKSPNFSWKGFRSIDNQIAFIFESLDFRTDSLF